MKLGWRRQLLISRSELIHTLQAQPKPIAWGACCEKSGKPSPPEAHNEDDTKHRGAAAQQSLDSVSAGETTDSTPNKPNLSRSLGELAARTVASRPLLKRTMKM